MDRNLRNAMPTVAALAAALSPAAAHAHPGLHEGETGGLVHAVTQPDHLLALLLVIATILWAPRLLRRAATVLRHRTPSPTRVAATTEAGR